MQNHIDTVIAMMVTSIIMPVVTTFMSEIVKLLTSLIKHLMTPKEQPENGDDGDYSVIIQYESAPLSASKNGFGVVTRREESNNSSSIDAILWYIGKHAKPARVVKQNLIGSEADKVGTLLRQHTILIPQSSVTHDDIVISMKITNNGAANDFENATRTYTMTLSSQVKTIKQIQEFVAKCAAEFARTVYTDKKMAKIYLRGGHSYNCVEKTIPFSTTFDTIFFPEKQMIMTMANRYRIGKLTKLSFLLHGEPGCGKTSIIRALAEYLEMNVVQVKLSSVQDDEELVSIFQGPTLDVRSLSTGTPITKNKCIFVLEDIDADGTVAHARNSSNGEPISPVLNTNATFEHNVITTLLTTTKPNPEKAKSKVTLSGLLNALDGIVELRGIVIMTTNHPEKLDPALVRPGRITRKIKLGRMLANDAHDLIKYHFGEHSLKIKDGQFTPATLNSFCQSSLDLGELQTLISEHNEFD